MCLTEEYIKFWDNKESDIELFNGGDYKTIVKRFKGESKK